MKIRQYTAPTIQEAILKIKVDLGPNAVILHSRKTKKGGIWGFFTQDVVEVLAADPGDAKEKSGLGTRGAIGAERDIAPEKATGWGAASEPDELELGPLGKRGFDRPATVSSDRHEPAAPRGSRPPASAQEWESPPARAPQQVAVAEALAEPVASREGERIATAAAVEGADNKTVPSVIMMPDSDRLVDEVSDLKATVTDLKAMMASLAGKLDMAPRSVAQFPTLMQKVYDRLLSLDVDASIARGLVVYLQKEQPHLKTYEDLCDALEAPVAGLLKVSGPIAPLPGERKIVSLVGPTGVGKTTTIAKLAANFALARQADMALLTIDTYRVAAIEQLKTYGDIIGLPVDVVLTPQSLKEALKQHQDKGLILIDTAGRSPYNRLHINELRSFLDVEPQVEAHLVLSATTRLADLKQIVKHFASTGVDRLIFSKTDETDIIGGAISIAHETGLPVSYITTGQSVPDDISVAEGETLARMLVAQMKS